MRIKFLYRPVAARNCPRFRYAILIRRVPGVTFNDAGFVRFQPIALAPIGVGSGLWIVGAGQGYIAALSAGYKCPGGA